MTPELAKFAQYLREEIAEPPRALELHPDDYALLAALLDDYATLCATRERTRARLRIARRALSGRDEAMRVRAKRWAAQGKPATWIAAKLGRDVSTIHRWLKAAKEAAKDDD